MQNLLLQLIDLKEADGEGGVGGGGVVRNWLGEVGSNGCLYDSPSVM